MNGHTFHFTTQVEENYHHITASLPLMHMDEIDQDGHIVTLDANHISTLQHDYENFTTWPFLRHHFFTLVLYLTSDHLHRRQKPTILST